MSSLNEIRQTWVEKVKKKYRVYIQVDGGETIYTDVSSLEEAEACQNTMLGLKRFQIRGENECKTV